MTGTLHTDSLQQVEKQCSTNVKFNAFICIVFCQLTWCFYPKMAF
jgi:hypothetical protein